MILNYFKIMSTVCCTDDPKRSGESFGYLAEMVG